MNSHTFVVLAYKESKFLDDCIKSLLNQSVKSNIVIATTTPNDFIRKLAFKYNIKIIEGHHTSIGGDFNFALNCVDSSLVTIAHQDDVYERTYTENILKFYRKYNDAIILFTNYYEIRLDKKVYNNFNMLIKRILLFSLSLKKLSSLRFLKRNSLRFGCSICCPSVTFNKSKCYGEVFASNLKCDVDWYAWEKLSNYKGKFIYIKRRLMGHRIDESTTTTDIINKGIRTKEDLIILKKFWPNFIAKYINKFYSRSEKSNNITNERKKVD